MRITHQGCVAGSSTPRVFTLRGVHERDLIVRKIGQTGQFYEQRLLDHLARRMTPGGLVIDVGSNIGNHAVFFGAYLADFVACVEPVPTLADCLEANLRENGITASRVFRCGAGDRPGCGHVPADVEGLANSGCIQIANDQAERTVSVPIRTIDDLVMELAAHRPVTLMKIDVEGMQDQVLAGASATLRDDRPQLVIEAGSPAEKARMLDVLAPLGYRIVATFGATATYHLIDPARHALRPLPLGERVRDVTYRLHRTLRTLGRAA